MPLDPDLTEFSTASPVIATYDWTDISDGTGNVVFYAYSTETAGGLDHHLTRQTPYSSQIVSAFVLDPSGTLTLNFDLSPFNLPKTIEGTGLVMVPIRVAADVGSSLTATIRARVLKNTTELVSVTSQNVVAGASATTYEMIVMPLVIARTDFAEGDFLRLEIKISITAYTGSGGSADFAHDPKGRDDPGFDASGNNISTQLVFNIPFKSNL